MTLLKFSANLGFLWNHLPLADAIRAAAAAGFDAVECHFPYDQDIAAVQAALAETGLPMLGLNTTRGDVERDQFGRAAVPGLEAEGRADIEQGIQFGSAIGAGHLHVMAGVSAGEEATRSFCSNLLFAADLAAEHGMQILIEPLNRYDNPGYFLNGTAQAIEIIETVKRPNLKLMFDCYHVQILDGDLSRRLKALLPHIGHIQIAGVPTRNEPDRGEVAYDRLIPMIYESGYAGYIGAEYRPLADVEAGLGWLLEMKGK